MTKPKEAKKNGVKTNNQDNNITISRWRLAELLAITITPCIMIFGIVTGVYSTLAQQKSITITNLKRELGSSNHAVRITAISALAEYPEKSINILVKNLGRTRSVNNEELEDIEFNYSVRGALLGLHKFKRSIIEPLTAELISKQEILQGVIQRYSKKEIIIGEFVKKEIESIHIPSELYLGLQDKTEITKKITANLIKITSSTPPLHYFENSNLLARRLSQLLNPITSNGLSTDLYLFRKINDSVISGEDALIGIISKKFVEKIKMLDLSSFISRKNALNLLIQLIRESSFVKPQSLDIGTIDLSGANLKGVNFSDTNIKKSILMNTNLDGVRLVGTELKDAKLKGVKLKGANLNNSDFREANLTDADLTEADLTNTNLKQANLTGAKMLNANLKNANLENTILEGADMQFANLRNVILTGANLRGANMLGVKGLSENQEKYAKSQGATILISDQSTDTAILNYSINVQDILREKMNQRVGVTSENIYSSSSGNLDNKGIYASGNGGQSRLRPSTYKDGVKLIEEAQSRFYKKVAFEQNAELGSFCPPIYKCLSFNNLSPQEAAKNLAKWELNGTIQLS